MQKKIRKVMSVFMVSALLFSGCGIHGTDNVKKEEDNENNNIVKLTVWSEKDNVDTTSKMVESFKEHYKDEAQFDITIDVQADAKVRDVMLTGIIELVYIVLQSVVKPGITGFFKIDLHIKCYIYLS